MLDRNEFVTKWYGKYLPQNFKQFINFGAKSVEFANHIANVKNINILNCETAYMDVNGKIYHPAMWYMAEYYTDVLNVSPEDALYTAISLHNGGQIHESLHVKLTDLGWYSKLVIEAKGESNQLLKFCFNIIEDIYIEHYGLETYQAFFNYNRYLNDVYFPSDMLETFLSDLDNRQNFINALISWKRIENRNVINTVEKLDKYTELFTSVLDINRDFNKRLELSVQFYKMLLEDGVTLSDIKNQMPSSDGGEIVPIHIAEKIDKFIQDNYKKLEKLEQEIDNIKNDLPPQKRDDEFSNIGSRLEFKFNWKNKSGGISLDKRFSTFANYIRTVKTPKPDFFLAKDKGNTLLERELYRIGIDGNCLTDKIYKTNKKDKPQFLILIDSSGSMDGIYKNVTKSAGAMYMSLINADIPVSLWGHSGEYYPVIYGIASYKMPFHTKNKRETTINPLKSISNAIHIPLQQNYDGYVIQSLSEYFNNDRQKYMIVLSDGSPLGHDYYGTEHTKNIVNYVRKTGVNVYAISLTQGVKKSNDNIYGEQYNVLGYKNLDSELKKLIVNLI